MQSHVMKCITKLHFTHTFPLEYNRYVKKDMYTYVNKKLNKIKSNCILKTCARTKKTWAASLAVCGRVFCRNRSFMVIFRSFSGRCDVVNGYFV